MKQMFNISEEFIFEQSDDIYGVNTINWEDSSWKHSFFDWWWRSHQSVAHTKKFNVFSGSVLCFGKMNENPQSNYAWEDKLYIALETIDGESMEFEWKIFPGFTTLQLNSRVQEFLSNMSIEPEDSTGLSSCRCLTTSHGDPKKNEREYELSAQLVSMSAKRFSPGRWSFLGLGSEKKWYSTHEYKPKENGTESLNWWWSNAEKADTQFSEPRLHCLEKRWKAKEVENYLFTSVLMGIPLKLCFAQLFLTISSISTEQSQICVMKTESAKQERWNLCWQNNLAHCSSQQICWWKHLHLRPKILHRNFFLQKYKERVEMLPQQNRVIKFCTDAGFLTTVKVGQYFMTKDTEEFSQFTDSVACREYTLPRDQNHLTQKGWMQGNTKIGHVLEVTTSYLQGKYGVEIRIESVHKDNSHSWVRISHGLIRVGHRLDRQWVRRQRTGNTWNEDGNVCVEDGSICTRMPIKDECKKQKDLPLLAHLHELNLFVKEYGLILNQELNLIKRTQWPKE